MRANEIKEGQLVKHSGEWHEVLAVRHQGPVITCITAEGGRISFMSGSKVTIQ